MSEKPTTQAEEQEIHQLYQSLAQEQPALELDETILAAAHKAVEGGSAAQATVTPMKPKFRAWYVPLSYAAVIVVSLSVVLRLLLEPEVINPEIMPERGQSVPQQDSIELHMEKEPAAAMAPAPFAASEPAQERVKKAAKMKAADARSKTSTLEEKQPYSRPEMLRHVLPTESDFSDKMQLQSAAGNGAVQGMALDAAADKSRDAWLKEMEQLLADRKYEQLKNRLKQFRQIYPDYALPEALSAWEKQAASTTGD